MEYGNYTKLALEMSDTNAKRIVFRRPDGVTMVANHANEPTMCQTLDVKGNEMPCFTDMFKEVWFYKDVCGTATLTSFVGKTKLVPLSDNGEFRERRLSNVENLIFKVTYEDDDTKMYEIFDGDELVLTAEMIKRKKPKRKLKSKGLFNELVSFISKEYTFKSGESRVLIGIDTTDCDWIRYPLAFRRAVEKGFPNIMEYNVPAFVVDDNKHIYFGTLDAMTGRCTNVITTLSEDTMKLSAENRKTLHRYREKYLETLKETKELISREIEKNKIGA